MDFDRGLCWEVIDCPRQSPIAPETWMEGLSGCRPARGRVVIDRVNWHCLYSPACGNNNPR